MASITMLSDFGLQDASVGKARGVLLSLMPDAAISDISHEVPPFSVGQAGYLLDTFYRSFPGNTVHLVLIDVFSHSLPRLVLCYFEGHYFLTADNGVLSDVLKDRPYNAWLCFELTKEKTFNDWVQSAARVIKSLRTLDPDAMGLPPYQLSVTQGSAISLISSNTIVCNVRYIDNFGNVVTDITAEYFHRLNVRGKFKMRFMHVNEISEISINYNDVRRGVELARFNSKGYLEICVNRGNAAMLFGFRMGGIHNEIKITFE